MYADDLVLLSPSPTALQRLVNYCVDFTNVNDALYNSTKSKLLVVKSAQYNTVSVPPMLLNNVPLPIVDQIKYLGVFITSNMSDNTDIDRQKSYIYGRGNNLIKCFKYCTEDVKTLLFKSYCTNLYCSHLWSVFTKRCLGNLTTAYNQMFRMLLAIRRGPDHSTSHAMTTLNVDTCAVTLRKKLLRFKNRISRTNHPIVHAAWDTVCNSNCTFYKRLCHDLYVLR